MKSRITLGEKLKDLRLTDDNDTYVPSEPILPPWKVYFEGSFWNEHGRSRAGIEVPVGISFQWNGQEIFVPSVYSCAKQSVFLHKIFLQLLGDVMVVPVRDCDREYLRTDIDSY